MCLDNWAAILMFQPRMRAEIVISFTRANNINRIKLVVNYNCLQSNACIYASSGHMMVDVIVYSIV